MKPTELQELGAHLKESITTTANVNAFILDLTKKLKGGEPVTVTVQLNAKNVLTYSFK